jgi:hypothetical protein
MQFVIAQSDESLEKMKPIPPSNTTNNQTLLAYNLGLNIDIIIIIFSKSCIKIYLLILFYNFCSKRLEKNE